MIKHATAIYTGGGIYIYYGELTDGTYFRTCDMWECIEICNANTGSDEADYEEFYEEHSLRSITDKEYVVFFNDMIRWILENKPEGNYSEYELEERLYKEVEVYE